MEDIRSYLESGILELYVLGELSADEVAQVEELASKHQEIRDEIAAIELALERYAVANAVEPGADVEERLYAALGLHEPHASADAHTSPVLSEKGAEATIVPLERDKTKVRTLQMWLTAAVVLLIGSIGALFYTYTQLSDARQQIAGLNLQNQQFAKNAGYIKQANDDLKKMVNMGNDANWKAVRLAGTKLRPDAKMMVYWNRESKQVMVNNVNMALPKNDQQHQYQLWALVNGKPVDLGVFDAGKDTASVMIKMKEISIAQAFAVTLEPAGGSVNPTLEQMVVMGEVAI